jgi:hypothetical protein
MTSEKICNLESGATGHSLFDLLKKEGMDHFLFVYPKKKRKIPDPCLVGALPKFKILIKFYVLRLWAF